MQELKFKLYNKDYGMLQVRRLQGDDITFPKYIDCKTRNGIKQFQRAKKNLIQYTGIKDKNKVEIYYNCEIFTFDYNDGEEILKLTGSFYFDEDELRTGIDIYYNPEFVCLWYDYLNMTNFEVIGNLFENSEIIKN